MLSASACDNVRYCLSPWCALMLSVQCWANKFSPICCICFSLLILQWQHGRLETQNLKKSWYCFYHTHTPGRIITKFFKIKAFFTFLASVFDGEGTDSGMLSLKFLPCSSQFCHILCFLNKAVTCKVTSFLVHNFSDNLFFFLTEMSSNSLS